MDLKNLSPRDLAEVKNTVTGYTYPTAHTGKSNYVDYYYFLPDSGEKKRVKKFFDHIKKKSERKAEMEKYIQATAVLLRQGWRPFHSNTTDRSYRKFKEILGLYRSGLVRYDRQKTIDNYSSRIKIMEDYLKEHNLEDIYCYEFDNKLCVEFLDWLMFKREVSPRTINNYKGWLSSLAKWMIDRTYIRENPVENIRKLRENEKKRQPLSSDQLKKVFEYLKETDRPFLLACLFEYYTFIRPQELSHVRIGDINIKNQTVFVPGKVSKNHRDGMVALNPILINLMIDLGYLFKPSDYYLFGKNFEPSSEHADADHFNKRWTSIRKRLKFPNDLKFYSLKDSGIRDLANVKGVVVARNQARHTDISTTNKYLQGRDLSAPAEAKDFTGAYIPD